ncbi:MAG: ABC transporter ATP-binding protein [Methylobacteriaceae bacterium]|nr:ABC transporter ATP-binding protein [Methylobacteriaceae bacterium]MBV9701495.1 ABC transporter ATP-binding protein [Methylobacteriaceae bacterium]
MAAAGLEAEGLSAGYGGARILDAVSFSVPAASRLAVLGRNGTGKTTLFATLMGQTRRHAGRIVVGGRDVTSLGSAARARAGLGYVPQTRNIFRSLTVEENLIVGLKGRSRSALGEAYAMFPRLFERRRHRGDRLSGGEQQMLSTARTLLGRPSVLLLDEPLEGLAPIICEELMAALTRQAEAGTMTIALVEQKLESALDFADSVLILERGRIAWAGSARQLRAEHHVIERLLAVGAFAEER